jgi:hypothetical protein
MLDRVFTFLLLLNMYNQTVVEVGQRESERIQRVDPQERERERELFSVYNPISSSLLVYFCRSLRRQKLKKSQWSGVKERQLPREASPKED